MVPEKNELVIILDKFNLTKEELVFILESFQTQTMNNMLQSCHKSPRFEEKPDEDFYVYDMYKTSCKILERTKKNKEK